MLLKISIMTSAKAQRPEYEYLAVIGAILNFSDFSVGGYTPQLQWGKWMQGPRFPIEPKGGQTKFHASGVSQIHMHMHCI